MRRRLGGEEGGENPGGSLYDIGAVVYYGGLGRRGKALSGCEYQYAPGARDSGGPITASG